MRLERLGVGPETQSHKVRTDDGHSLANIQGVHKLTQNFNAMLVLKFCVNL